VRGEFGEDVSQGEALYLVDPDDPGDARIALCFDWIGGEGENVPGPHAKPGYSLTDEVSDVFWIGSTVGFVASTCRYPSHYFHDNGNGGLDDDPGVCDENKGYACGSEEDPLPGYSGSFLLYHAEDLLAVTRGEAEPWEPRPYAEVPISEYLMDAGCRASVAGAAFREDTRRLYVIELNKDTNDRPVCHVWGVR
jgi:hypothetical protein